MTDNAELADRLEEFADLLEANDVEYKPRAYRRAAENVAEYPEDVADLATEGVKAVEEIDRVGEAIAAKIVEYVETGTIEELEALREELPVEMDALTSVEGVGPKTVGTLYEALGIQTLDDLEAAAEAGEIQDVSGFGAKTEQNILGGIDFAREAHERQLLGEARPRGERVREYLQDVAAVEQCELAGSLRRWKPTIGDVDALVASTEGPAVVEAFTDWDGADRVIEAGDQKASVRSGGVRIDLRVIDPSEFGAALQYFTGSKDHNVDLRNRAIDRDLKLNEYGVFDVSAVADDADDQRAGERVAGESEAGVYDALDLSWIPPELRENRGEIAAAAEGNLPELVEIDDLSGDLHVHTDWSDGNNTIEEMAAAAAERGDEYVCITDHATGPGMVGGVGLSDDELRDQRAAIEGVDEARDDITVLAGVEANISATGEVSVGDEVLETLDLVVASPHAGLDGDGTDRLIEAARHPAVDVIGHPTGRQLNRRPGLDVDVPAVAEVAAEHDTALEVNANPYRLDLEGGQVKRAIEAGATIAIDTDAHRPESFDYRRFGVHTARRGWAEDGDVLNARSADGLRAFLD
ncbi:DNA polymerase beta subunit protein [Halorhabdus tiamatea SARL4B]|uniref:DNA polymerase beta n=1 Tax=Halorhabdus tiamatea SARL4B TaxID=1033806 RepID=F7PFJ7_9EURY|nr:DNA polymerase/3'-5' exonuclease PolX [Halorhabdus tiamatea]ERJ06418.1 DNA polymerase beta subunit protein [Halorhabdus tiamatea SARL4B]CCQ34343.1 DNA polymerase X family protein [Halorhabdus tiamatea SARL4B]